MEALEDRRMLSVTAVEITAITSPADTDGLVGDEHVTVNAGDMVTVSFNYTTAGKTGTTTQHLEIWDAAFAVHYADLDVSNSVQDEPVGVHSGSADVDTTGLATGDYGVKVKITHQGNLADQDPNTPNEPDSGITIVAPAIVVTPTVGLTANDAVYTGLPYDETNLGTTVVDDTTDVSSLFDVAYKFYSDVGGLNEVSVPTNAGTYYVQAFATSNDPGYNDATSNILEFQILKADAAIEVQGYSGTYDGQPHGLSGSATGVTDEDLGGLLDLGASYTNAGSYTVDWSFAGNENYNADAGTCPIIITPATLTADARTQASLNVSKAGTIAFHLRNFDGIVDGQSLADLIDGTTLSLEVNGVAYSMTATVELTNAGTVTVGWRMSAELQALLLNAWNGTKSGNQIELRLTAASNDGNYTLDVSAFTRVFQQGKLTFPI